MKNSLKEKIRNQGRLAEELVNTEGFKLISKKIAEKRSFLLQEALTAETIEHLKYTKGFIDGLDFFKLQVEQMIQRRENLKKAN